MDLLTHQRCASGGALRPGPTHRVIDGFLLAVASLRICDGHCYQVAFDLFWIGDSGLLVRPKTRKCLFRNALLFPILISSGWAQFYTIRTFGGGGEPYNEHALTAHLATPTSLVLDQRGNLYVSLSNYSIVVRVAAGTVTRIAGNGTQGFSGDNGHALDAQLSGPTRLAVDGNGNVYIYDSLNYLALALAGIAETAEKPLRRN
jgi:hypothetical protein